MKLIKLLFFSVMALMLSISISSCSSSGSGTDNTPQDTDAPAVISVSPVDSASNVQLDSVITIEFSEAIDPDSVDSLSITFEYPVFNTISGIFSFNGDNTTLTFTPAADLPQLTTITVTVTTRVENAAGNPIEADYQWSFTTSNMVPADPQVDDFSPWNGQIDIAYIVNPEISFNEDLKESTINSSTIIFTNESGPVACTLALNNNGPDTTVTIDPDPVMTHNTTYTITVTTDVQDLAGNALMSECQSSFTTALDLEYTYPELDSTYPANGYTDVDVSEAITITFNTDIDSATINSDTFSVTYNFGSDPVTVPGTYSFDSGTDTATFTPDSDLGSLVTYTVAITTDIQDLNGYSLNTGVSYIFTTDIPGTVNNITSNSSDNHVNPKAAFNSSGNGVALWLKEDGTGTGTLMYSEYTESGSTWSDPAELDTGLPLPGGSSTGTFDIASNGIDFMAVYWKIDGGEIIHFRTFNGSWSVDDNFGGTYQGHDPDIVSNGSSYCLTWSTNDPGIFARIYSSSTWGDIKDFGNGYNPVVASNGTGYCVAWNYFGVYTNIFDGTDWESSSQTINSSDADDPVIVSNGTGYCVAWEGGEVIYANIYSTSAWGTETSIGETGGNYNYVDLASDGTGYAAVWHSYEQKMLNDFLTDYNEIKTASFNTSWSAEEIIGGGDNANAFYPKIAFNGTDYSVMWQQRDEYLAGYASVIGNIFYDSTWGNPGIYENSDNAVENGSIRVYAAGTGFMALWVQENDTGSDIWAIGY